MGFDAIDFRTWRFLSIETVFTLSEVEPKSSRVIHGATSQLATRDLPHRSLGLHYVKVRSWYDDEGSSS